MPENILKITFNGICILNPSPPREGDSMPDQAFVLMAANREERKNDWDATVPEHFPFIYVPVSVLQEPIPPPDATTADQTLGDCYIYFINDARVAVSSMPSESLRYYTEKLPLAERPGSDDVASENDIRWLADFRDILQGPVRLKPTADPRQPSVGSEVAVVVELAGGTLKAGFPCKSVQPVTFKDARGEIVPGFKRVLANEFFIEMPYPEALKTIKIQLQPIRPPAPAAGLGDAKELILKWPEQGRNGQPPTIDVRMGNDAKSETTQFLGKPERCNARSRDALGKPMLIPRDNDFFLHYQIIDSGGKGNPVPQIGIQQITIDGCRGGAA